MPLPPTTFNHSNSAADGGSMVATDVTNADGQLDAAIGDLSGTGYTNVAAALLAIFANAWVATARIADNAITAAKIATSAIGSGLTGGGGSAIAVNTDNSTTEVVSNAIQVKNLGITGAKLQRDALSPVNVIADPYNLTTPLKLTAEAGVNGHPFQWWPRNSQAALDDTVQVLYNDSNNPFGPTARTLRFRGASASSVFGFLIPVTEARWSTGMQISGRVYCAAQANGGTWRLDFREVNASGTPINSAQLGVGQALSSGVYGPLDNIGATVGGGASYMLMFISRTAGTVDLDIYWEHAGTGVYVPNMPAPSPRTASVFVPRKHMVEGTHLLQDYTGQAAKVLGADGTSQDRVGWFGDSWVQRMDLTTPLRTYIQTALGDGGRGWTSFWLTFVKGSTYYDGLSATAGATQRTGTWTDRVRVAGATGLDISDITTSDVTATIKLTYTYAFTSATLLTLQQSGGGSFQYRVNGGAWSSTISTAGTSDVIATSITGITGGTPLIEIQIISAGTAGVTFHGLIPAKAGNYGVLHRIGIESSTVAHWTQVDATLWQTGVAKLNLNLALILLGTNDKTGNVTPQLYASQLATLVGRIRAALPFCDIVIVSPSDVLDNGGTTYSVAQYASAARTVAASLDVAYFDGYALMPSNADANLSTGRGLMEVVSGGNSRHLTSDGGRVFAGQLWQRLLRVG
jgi:hypothetical protein